PLVEDLRLAGDRGVEQDVRLAVLQRVQDAVEERAELDAAVAVVVVGGLAVRAVSAAFALALGGLRALLGRRGALLRGGRGVRVGLGLGAVGRGPALVGTAALALDVLA